MVLRLKKETVIQTHKEWDWLRMGFNSWQKVVKRKRKVVRTQIVCHFEIPITPMHNKLCKYVVRSPKLALYRPFLATCYTGSHEDRIHDCVGVCIRYRKKNWNNSHTLNDFNPERLIPRQGGWKIPTMLATLHGVYSQWDTRAVITGCFSCPHR